MSKLPLQLRERAIHLRQKGYGVKEIAALLTIAVGTSSLWLRNVTPSFEGKKRLKEKRLLGYHKIALGWQQKRTQKESQYQEEADRFIRKVPVDSQYFALLISLLFWCEGGKQETAMVRLVNSDPKLIASFLFLMRRGFPLEEKKFRVRLFFHEYHNEKKQKLFWARITGISLKQFRKTYIKPHTGKRERIGYPGCAVIVYHDTSVLSQLKALYRAFAKQYG